MSSSLRTSRDFCGLAARGAFLARFGHLEGIPLESKDWHVNATNASALAKTLATERDRALLFRTLATLRTDIELFHDVDQLRWNGPTPDFDAMGARFDAAVNVARRPKTARLAH